MSIESQVIRFRFPTLLFIAYTTITLVFGASFLSATYYAIGIGIRWHIEENVLLTADILSSRSGSLFISGQFDEIAQISDIPIKAAIFFDANGRVVHRIGNLEPDFQRVPSPRILSISANSCTVIFPIAPDRSDPLLTGTSRLGYAKVLFDVKDVKPIITLVTTIVGVTFFAVWAIMIIPIFLLARHLSKPLIELSQNMRKISSMDENRKVNVPIQSRVEELATIQDSFNKMTTSLAALETQKKVLLSSLHREAAEKITERLRFVSELAHETVLPLSVIRMNLKSVRCDLMSLDNLFKVSIQDPEINRHTRQSLEAARSIVCDMDANIRRITEAADAIARETRSVINEAKGEKGNRNGDWVAFFERFEELARSIQPFIEDSGNRFVVENGIPENTLLFLDVDGVECALRNLLDNARKYTRNGQIALRAFLRGRILRLQVEDTGRGIPVEDQMSIFDPYLRLDSGTSEGIGLGLYIAKKRIIQMGGRIVLKSAPGKGSVFCLLIPVKVRFVDLPISKPAA